VFSYRPPLHQHGVNTGFRTLRATQPISAAVYRAYKLRRISLPRTWANKGMGKCKRRAEVP
jgi:hypothetical protein